MRSAFGFIAIVALWNLPAAAWAEDILAEDIFEERAEIAEAQADVEVAEAVEVIEGPVPAAPPAVPNGPVSADSAGPARTAESEPGAPGASVNSVPKPDSLRIYLTDGSVVSGKIATDKIEVDTEFGKLTIPIAEVRKLTPGLASHPELNLKINELIEKLGSNEFPEREAAQKELIKMGGQARPQLVERRNDEDTERRMRIKAILDEMDQANEDALEDEDAKPAESIGLLDRVETPHFTVVGRVTNKTFTIASLYGPLNVKLGDIARAEREQSKKEEIRKTVNVDGTNIIQRSWKVTNIRVERGDNVTLSADGKIVMSPWGSSTYSTPEGGANFGWYLPGTIPSGALVASIGNNEKVIKVGSKANFKADRSGVLKLSIAMQGDYASNSFPGEYVVKVRVNPQ